MDSCPFAVPAAAREAGDSKRSFGRLYSEPCSLALDPGQERGPLFHEFASTLEEVRPPVGSLHPVQFTWASASSHTSRGASEHSAAQSRKLSRKP